MWLWFSRLTQHSLKGVQLENTDVKIAVLRTGNNYKEVLLYIRNCSEYFANSGFEENDYHILQMKMPQFTVGIVFYFLANIQKFSCFQRTYFLTKHFSNLWKRITNWELPNCIVVIIDHPSIVFTRPNSQKNAVAWSYQKKNKWLFIEL